MEALSQLTEALVQRGFKKVDPDPIDGLLRPDLAPSWTHLPANESPDGWAHIWICEPPETLYALQFVFSPSGEMTEAHVCNLLDGDQVATTEQLTGSLDQWLTARTAVIAAQHAEVDTVYEMAALYPQGWRLADDLLEGEEK